LKKVIGILLIVSVLFSAAACAGGGGGKTVVQFLNWGDYIDMDVIARFESENPDIQINMTTVPSNEEMYIVATTQGSDVDVVVPSDYMVERLAAEGKLASLQTDKMENYRYVSDFSDQYQFGGSKEYAVPYAWGTFGILYNTKMVSDPVDSWSILWNEKYKGKIFMYDSIRDTLGIALIRLGYSMNSRSEQELDAAADLLIEQKPLVLAYGTDDIRMSMINGSAALATVYAGDAVYCMADNPDLKFVLPLEGANIFVDNLCIMKDTDVYDASLTFIDFLCKPEIAAKNSEYTGYSTPVADALQYMDPSLTENNAYNPSEEEMKNLAFYEYLGEDLNLYDNAWMKVKSS
jgi:spermidine/putrescine transport system substrate-binding protein